MQTAPAQRSRSVCPCRRSTAVVQRFCKPKVGSSILSAGTSQAVDFHYRQRGREVGAAHELAGPIDSKCASNCLSPHGFEKALHRLDGDCVLADGISFAFAHPQRPLHRLSGEPYAVERWAQVITEPRTGGPCCSARPSSRGQKSDMRLLIINPNTTASITAKLADAALRAFPGNEVLSVTGRIGATSIASRASYAIAAHSALDCYARYADRCDVVLLGCYGDPGLDALREIASQPVVGLIEAAAVAAAAKAARFSIVTGGDRWKSMLEETLVVRALAGNVASIRTVSPTGKQIADDPQSAIQLLAEACRRCVDEDGARAVILGGAGLIGLAAVVEPLVGVPVICSVEAGFEASRLAFRKQPNASQVSDSPQWMGLSDELTALLAEPGACRRTN